MASRSRAASIAVPIAHARPNTPTRCETVSEPPPTELERASGWFWLWLRIPFGRRIRWVGRGDGGVGTGGVGTGGVGTGGVGIDGSVAERARRL
jgi:hypothetical protein